MWTPYLTTKPQEILVNGLNFTSLTVTRHTIADYNVEPQAVVFILLTHSCTIVLILMIVPVVQYYY